MHNTHQFIISRCLSALQRRFVFVIFTSSKIAICKNVSPACIIHLNNKRWHFYSKSAALTMQLTWFAISLVAYKIYCATWYILQYNLWRSICVSSSYITNMTTCFCIPYRAKFSWVFNFANFVNFQPFTKIFQQRFDMRHAVCVCSKLFQRNFQKSLFAKIFRPSKI